MCNFIARILYHYKIASNKEPTTKRCKPLIATFWNITSSRTAIFREHYSPNSIHNYQSILRPGDSLSLFIFDFVRDCHGDWLSRSNAIS